MAIRPAIALASNCTFRVIHFSVQRDHIHIIVEADDTEALSRGLSGLLIRVARALNSALDRRGPVWGDRYHAHALRTPAETRSGILYVLQNWKKHLRGVRGVDPCSSGRWFTPVAQPRTWLAARGWRDRGGGPLDAGEAPA